VDHGHFGYDIQLPLKKLSKKKKKKHWVVVVAAAREQDAALNDGKKFNASNKGSYYGFQERKHKDLVFLH
jgi:hypothetical protein